MIIDFVTKENLQILRAQLMDDIRGLLSGMITRTGSAKVEGLKTKDVRNILGCSVNKLVSLRVGRKIGWKKIGGTVYYNREDVKRLLEEGY